MGSAPPPRPHHSLPFLVFPVKRNFVPTIQLFIIYFQESFKAPTKSTKASTDRYFTLTSLSLPHRFPVYTNVPSLYIVSSGSQPNRITNPIGRSRTGKSGCISSNSWARRILNSSLVIGCAL